MTALAGGQGTHSTFRPITPPQLTPHLYQNRTPMAVAMAVKAIAEAKKAGAPGGI